VLNLANNKNIKLPDQSFSALKSLAVLNIEHTGVQYIPSTLWELPIEKLLASNIGLTEFPTVVFSLTKLRRLLLRNNAIERLPSEGWSSLTVSTLSGSSRRRA
jgi:Leucine-rich repeat (LRR) protein